MHVEVMAATPIVTTGVFQGSDLLLHWTGGIAPFQVQVSTNLANPARQNLGAPAAANSLLIKPTNGNAFYRVQGQ